MKRTIFTITLLFAVFITACGGSAPQTAPEPAASTEAVSQPTETPAVNTEAASPTDTPTTEAAASSTVSFSVNVMPIFEAKCNECHGIETTKKGLNMLTYDGLMAGSFDGEVIVPGNADESVLVQLTQRGKMPKRGPKVTAEELQLIKDCVNQGALNN